MAKNYVVVHPKLYWAGGNKAGKTAHVPKGTVLKNLTEEQVAQFGKRIIEESKAKELDAATKQPSAEELAAFKAAQKSAKSK